MPSVARAIIDMQARLRKTAEQVDLMAGHLTGEVVGAPAPFEAVRDYFYNNRNYIASLDEEAEALGRSVRPGRMAEALTDRLAARHPCGDGRRCIGLAPL